VWVKLDDRFPTNPKVEGLSAYAFRAYVEGLCHCALHLTDGHLSAAATRRLAKPKPRAELIDGGLWDEAPDGSVWVHDYLLFQPSRNQVVEERERKARAGALGGAAKAANRLADS
jgi:hypothetical protein